jgi:hypothetical protein
MAERRRGSDRGPWAATVALVAAMTLALPAPAAAQTRLILDPAAGPRGITVDAIGAGYPPDSPISILWDGKLIKSVTSGSAASFKVAFRVPAAAPAGPHEVTMCVAGSGPGGCSAERDDATFTVASGATPQPSPGPPGSTLPEPSGAPAVNNVAGAPPDPLPPLTGALVIGAAAAVLVLVRRRRIAAAARRAAEPGAWRRRRAS